MKLGKQNGGLPMGSGTLTADELDPKSLEFGWEI
jgi:hypothetical protein